MNMYSAVDTAQALLRRHLDGAAARTEHAVFARSYWLAEARDRLRMARYWRKRLGGPYHEIALRWQLEAVALAHRYRAWARELGSR